MNITLNLPDDLASKLPSSEDELQNILALGMRKWNADRSQPAGFSDLLEALATLPTPEQVLALRPSAAMQQRVHELLEKNRTDGLEPEEELEWQRYEYVEHVMRLAKARAAEKMKNGDE